MKTVAQTRLWIWIGRTQGGDPGLSHTHFFFFEQIGLFIYLSISSYLPRPASEKVWEFLMRCDSARDSSHRWRVSAHTHAAHFSMLYRCQNHNCLGKCKPVTTKQWELKGATDTLQQHIGLVHGHMHELFSHNICYCEWLRRTLCGKMVIFNLNMQAQIFLFCLQAIKK